MEVLCIGQEVLRVRAPIVGIHIRGNHSNTNVAKDTVQEVEIDMENHGKFIRLRNILLYIRTDGGINCDVSEPSFSNLDLSDVCFLSYFSTILSL